MENGKWIRGATTQIPHEDAPSYAPETLNMIDHFPRETRWGASSFFVLLVLKAYIVFTWSTAFKRSVSTWLLLKNI